MVAHRPLRKSEFHIHEWTLYFKYVWKNLDDPAAVGVFQADINSILDESVIPGLDKGTRTCTESLARTRLDKNMDM
jgi:hypothetical protein